MILKSPKASSLRVTFSLGICLSAFAWGKTDWSVSSSVFASSNVYLNFKEWLFNRGVTQNCIIFTRSCNFLAHAKENCCRPSQVNMHLTFPCHRILSSWQVAQIWPPNSLHWGINLTPSPSVFKQGASSILTPGVHGQLWLFTVTNPLQLHAVV